MASSGAVCCLDLQMFFNLFHYAYFFLVHKDANEPLLLFV